MILTKLLYQIPCHRRADRSLFFHGKQFPLCARCTAIYAAYLILPIFAFIPKTIYFLILGILFQVPMFIDGYTQLRQWRESNNYLRVITGFISGIGQCLFIWYWTDFLTTYLKW
ncbi:DUF2085 domain-containing protein [Shimazuella kribbensis]|uniref:DUF2085 domain-containing protein n=1 Tax=Shimazuella kribbensis TaxID=139808 RepID=UPI0006860718|nr:DUF2085 domain-containing protein [Shimazuella kribbensis]